MLIDDIISLLKKKGFQDTFQVLKLFKDYKCTMRTFYNRLNKFSYYNSFLRVKEELINKSIIKIGRDNNKKYIKLTEKGLEVYNKLLEIKDIINEKI